MNFLAKSGPKNSPSSYKYFADQVSSRPHELQTHHLSNFCWEIFFIGQFHLPIWLVATDVTAQNRRYLDACTNSVPVVAAMHCHSYQFVSELLEQNSVRAKGFKRVKSIVHYRPFTIGRQDIHRQATLVTTLGSRGLLVQTGQETQS